MSRVLVIILVFCFWSCQHQEKKLTAQEIVDKSIQVSGGELHEKISISFDFRDRNYVSEISAEQNALKRLLHNDSIKLLDILTRKAFKRFQNDSLITVTDSMASVYSNSINSVHYFARLPYGLNDLAVKKELVGDIDIKGESYYKIKVTFDQDGGGDDYDDTYLYWFNKESFKVDYLAYEFHVNGGGMRFREAYNERYIGNIRFVDYKNSKPLDTNASLLQLDSLFINDKLQLLSKIELKNIFIP